MSDSLFSINEILDNPNLIPSTAGIYYWYFNENTIPHLINLHKCKKVQGNYLLMYVGISPSRKNSHQSLRSRIISNHLHGNASSSTLRRSLGCLLSEDLGIQLRCTENGKRVKFFTGINENGERILTQWMRENAHISWEEVNEPWNMEPEIIQTGFYPLNLEHNEHNENYPILSEIRKECLNNARRLPQLLATN